MKIILNGVRYDTEKATLIGEASSEVARSSFSWWEAGLYVSPRSQRYFLAGRGNAMSRFAQRVENGTSSGEGIFAMTKEEALAWAEQNLSTEVVEQHFADLIEDA